MTTSQDCDAERTIYRDSDIEVSVNHIRPEAPVWWRYVYHDEDWQSFWLQSGDMPHHEGAVIATVRAYYDMDKDDEEAGE